MIEDDVCNPYQSFPKSSFWKSGVVNENPFSIDGLYRKKWPLKETQNIATAGSCFAQHIARHLRSKNYNVLDVEPAPAGLPNESHNKFGYSMYSARYGNIYTVRQLLQLVKEVYGEIDILPEHYVWSKGDKFFDAFRPAIEPNGFDSCDEVVLHRQYHAKRVADLFRQMDVFVFTLGLTEAWQCKRSGLVFPTVPGAIAGKYDPELYEFKNFSYREIMDDFKELRRLLAVNRETTKPLRFILTVSPVPLTATASGKHVLQASTYSKSVLRAVAGDLSNNKHVDYFPSFEVITNINNRAMFYESNLRSIRREGVNSVMQLFFSEHGTQVRGGKQGDKAAKLSDGDGVDEEDVQCEEALLEAFGRG